MKPLVLIGGGGHARSVLAMLENSLVPMGYADIASREDMPITYLGTDTDVLARYSPDDCQVLVAVGFTNGCNLQVRSEIFKRFSEYACSPLIAPSAWISQKTSIGKGSVIMARAVINEAKIGSNVVVNTAAVVEHDCIIGNDSFIAPGAVICGGTIVGERVFVGASAVIRQSVTIAPNTIIGMGAVVISDIEEPGIYVGNPARKIK